MEDLPSNSDRSRERRGRGRPERGEKQIKKVVQGEVVRRQKPVGKRIREFFFRDIDQDTIYFDMIRPMGADLFMNVMNFVMEMRLYGEPRSRIRDGRRPGSRHVNYGGYYRGDSRPDPRDRERREISRRGRANFDFEEVILATRREADEAIDQLADIIEEYDVATVADLYGMLDIRPSFTDENYGWDDLRGAGVRRISSGYLLDLPRPTYIK